MNKSTVSQYARALYEATKGQSGKNLEKVIAGFVNLLARRQKLKQVGRIIEEFVSYAKKQEGIQRIEVTSAIKLNPSILEAIKQSFGKKVELSEKVTPEILGGVKIRTEDTILDASLKTQLMRLKQSLM